MDDLTSSNRERVRWRIFDLLDKPAKVKLTNISKFGQKYADFVKCAKPLFDFTGEFLPGTICSRADFTVSKSPSRTVKG